MTAKVCEMAIWPVSSGDVGPCVGAVRCTVISLCEVLFGIRVPERAEGACCDGLREVEGVSAEEVDVLEKERRDPGQVGFADVPAFLGEFIGGGLNVGRVPQPAADPARATCRADAPRQIPELRPRRGPRPGGLARTYRTNQPQAGPARRPAGGGTPAPGHPSASSASSRSRIPASRRSATRCNAASS